MKKILFTILLLFYIPIIYADEVDITKDVEVKVKWYKEELSETYFNKGEDLAGYLEDSSRVIYSGNISWSEDYCDNSPNQITRMVRTYQLLNNVKYILLDEFDYNNNVTILYKGKPYPYSINYNAERKTIFQLDQPAEINNLIIIVDTDNEYTVTLTAEDTQLLHKRIRNQKVLIPDESWIKLNSSYQIVTIIDSEITGSFVKLLKETKECAKREEQTYRYKIDKTYYDDEYHSFIEGYLPDYSDYKVFYLGNEIIKEKEITKYIKGEDIIKYIKGEDKISYVETECLIEPQSNPEPIKEIEYKYIDNPQIIEKVPSKIKYLIIILVFFILFFIGICLKMSSDNNS